MIRTNKEQQIKAEKKKLIIHIGSVKTGSTSIQKTLRESYEKLRKYNINYCEVIKGFYEYTLTSMFIKHPENHILFKKELESRNIAPSILIEEYRNYWNKVFLKNKEKTMIFSSEHLSLFSFDEESMLNFKIYLDQYFADYSIIIYIRDPINWLRSQVQETVKNGRRVSITKYCDDLIDSKESSLYNYEKLQKWGNVFGKDKIIVRQFDSEHFINGRLIDDFLYAANLDYKALELKEIKANTSIGYYSTLFLQTLNQSFPVLKNNHINNERGIFPYHFVYRVYSKDIDIYKKLPININKEQAEVINKELLKINKMIYGDCFIPLIKAEIQEVESLKNEVIPRSYFVKLINNYNLFIEELLHDMEKIKANTERESNIKYQSKFYSVYYKSSKKYNVILRNICLYLFYKVIGLKEFDKNYYLKRYPHVCDKVKDPLLHFMLRGVYRGYMPNKKFSVNNYIENHTEIILNGKNALLESNKEQKKRKVF